MESSGTVAVVQKRSSSKGKKHTICNLKITIFFLRERCPKIPSADSKPLRIRRDKDSYEWLTCRSGSKQPRRSRSRSCMRRTLSRTSLPRRLACRGTLLGEQKKRATRKKSPHQERLQEKDDTHDGRDMVVQEQREAVRHPLVLRTYAKQQREGSLNRTTPACGWLVSHGSLVALSRSSDEMPRTRLLACADLGTTLCSFL